jgi:hypothetical protein
MTTDPFTTAGAPPTGRGQAEDRADGVPRDRNGGYVLPGLDGSPPLTYKNGNPIGRVRASTIKNVTTDKTGIQKWQKEMIQRGLAKDPELAAENMAAVAADDKTWIRAVGERAFKVGGGKVAADRGTEFHEITEQIKKGEQVTPDQISDQIVARDVDAYLQVLADANLRPVPGMQERVVLLDHGGGGTFDDMFEWFNPDTEAYELLIGDTKTGADIWKYGSLEIIVQMVQYVHALAIWRSPKDGGPAPWGDYIPMPNVSKNHVAIVHAPQNGTAEAFIVDITGAEEVVEAALTIRRWRSDAKHRVRSISRVDLREASFVPPHDSMMNTVTQIENQADALAADPGLKYHPQVTEQVRQATPDQIKQERIRDERLARLSAATNPNTEGDNEAPAAEHDPVTGRKKRTCGYCRKPGHTQKNCPENPDSPKYQAPGPVGSPIEPAWLPTNDEILASTEPNEFAQGLPRETVTEQSAFGAIDVERQYCPGTCGQGWTTRPDMPGLSVCAVDGLPTKLHAEAMAKARAAAQPTPGLTVNGAPAVSFRPPDLISQSLAQAQTQQEVLNIRQACMDAGKWSDQYEREGLARYEALVPRWGSQ